MLKEVIVIGATVSHHRILGKLGGGMSQNHPRVPFLWDEWNVILRIPLERSGSGRHEQ
jgi:hypothetical protein